MTDHEQGTTRTSDIIDIENTIKLGIKRGGLFIPEIKKITEQKLRVILLIDNGGYSPTKERERQ